MEQKFNDEVIGISAEIAVADIFNVAVNSNYRIRGNEDIIVLLKKDIPNIFSKEDIPIPSKHVAEGQSSVDFILNNGETLSVKTNKKQLGKVAPQIIGQPTDETYFSHMKNELLDEIPEFDVINELKKRNLLDNYENRSKIFKEISIKYIDVVISEYWRNLIECNYLLLFYNIIDKNGNISKNPEYIVLRKKRNLPILCKENISFTQPLEIGMKVIL